MTSPAVRPSSELTRAAAHAVLEVVVSAAGEAGVPVVAWVVDAAGHDVAMTRMDESPLLSLQVAADKAWTAASFGQSTAWWSEMLAANPSLGALAHGNRLMAVPGGVPIVVDGRLVGGLGVSGGTAEQDAVLAAAGAAALDAFASEESRGAEH